MNAKLCAAAAAILSLLPVPCQDHLAVKAGRIIPVAGPALDDAVILMQNGRIQRIGKAGEVEIPWSAKVIDATGKVVLPTWVLAHSDGGQRGNNENMQNVPWLTVADSIDPVAIYFEDMLRNGVGTIHVLPGNRTLLAGTGLVVRPYGRTVEDMTVAANVGMKLSLQASRGGRLQQIRELRRALEDVREYLADFARRKAEFEREQAAGAIPADKKWTEEYDRKRQAAIDLVERRLRGWLYVPSYAEVDEALRLSQQLDLVVVLGANIDEAVAQLRRFNRPVVLDETIEYYERDEETRTERLICTPRLCVDAGVPFALSLGNSGPTSNAWWQLGTCVRHGVDRQTALEALTIVPARLLGLDDQLGSLAEGKLGNLQILTGDPFAATSWVDAVVLEGELVYERSKDPRFQYLFGPEAKAAAPAGDQPGPKNGEQNGGAPGGGR